MTWKTFFGGRVDHQHRYELQVYCNPDDVMLGPLLSLRQVGQVHEL